MSKRSKPLLRVGGASVRERRVQAARVGRGVERAVVGGDLREAGGVAGDGAVEGDRGGVVAGRDEREEKEEVAHDAPTVTRRDAGGYRERRFLRGGFGRYAHTWASLTSGSVREPARSCIPISPGRSE